MSWRFRRISELLSDLRNELLSLSDSGTPLFREVLIGPAATPAEAERLLDQCVGTPSAVILPGAVTHPRPGARNQREVRLAIYLRATSREATPQQPGAIHDLADRLCEQLLPDPTRPQTPRLLAGVAWEPLGQESLPPSAAGEWAVVHLLARDFRGPHPTP